MVAEFDNRRRADDVGLELVEGGFEVELDPRVAGGKPYFALRVVRQPPSVSLAGAVATLTERGFHPEK